MWVDQPRRRVWEFRLPGIAFLFLVAVSLDGIATVGYGQPPANRLTENAAKTDTSSSDASNFGQSMLAMSYKGEFYSSKPRKAM